MINWELHNSSRWDQLKRDCNLSLISVRFCTALKQNQSSLHFVVSVHPCACAAKGIFKYLITLEENIKIFIKILLSTNRVASSF